MNRGNLYDNMGEKDLALKDYNQAILLNPQLAEAYNNRGLLYAKNEEDELALRDFNQAILLNSQLAEAYGGRGIVYLFMNHHQQAIQDLEIAAKLYYEQGNPKYQQVLEMLKKLGQ